MGADSRSWFGRMWAWLFGRRPKATPGVPIPAPHTLVARVSAVEEAREREMLRLAEESIRRGHPEQAAIVYQKAADRYRKEGKAAKELAVLNLWARVSPRDPEVWLAQGNLHEAQSRPTQARQALTQAAALFRIMGRDEEADRLESRLSGLAGAADPASSDGLAAAPSAFDSALQPPPKASPAPVEAPPAVEEGPMELDLGTQSHQAIEDEAAALMSPVEPRSATAPRPPAPEPEPERLPTSALAALDDDEDEAEPERLPTSALGALDEDPDDASALDLPSGNLAALEDATGDVTGPFSASEDPTGEFGARRDPSGDLTAAGLSLADLDDLPDDGAADDGAPFASDPDAADDEIDPETMAELLAQVEAEADSEDHGGGSATIAMPAITGGVPGRRPAFNIPGAATVMDPRGLAGDDDDDDDLPEVAESRPEDRTRAYSTDEISKLLAAQRKKKGSE